MKKLRYRIFFLLVVIAFSACEKDDICVDGDTPLLVIDFLDFEDTENETPKVVPSIRVIGVGKTPIPTFNDPPAQERTDLESIVIPLDPTVTSVSFVFINDSADNDDGVETGNLDTLTFNYTVKEKFVSRACGFIAIYENLDFTLTGDDENWIGRVEIDTNLVEDQSRTHVKIFH
ncbi:DUF6452 family protein [Costertonia aggregata]|uniref:Lipoprotein n=1 Tax=Costertonia aggregata TaxID=343403 RepID=A0A7H9ALI2_9FLAO|nr:DUF6452 family protein [Costertonia aggregata]QLG44135.1 hypothetical protein HYG79_01800 [Costertonia aggregata]